MLKFELKHNGKYEAWYNWNFEIFFMFFVACLVFAVLDMKSCYLPIFKTAGGEGILLPVKGVDVLLIPRNRDPVPE